MKKQLYKIIITLPIVTSSWLANITTVHASAPTDNFLDTLFVGSNICCCLIPLVPLIINIALAVYIYKDAKKKNIENATLWGFLTLFFGLLPILFYLLSKNSNVQASQRK